MFDGSRHEVMGAEEASRFPIIHGNRREWDRLLEALFWNIGLACVETSDDWRADTVRDWVGESVV